MKNVYFIGIGGIGMSALARYYKFKGYAVAGYDRTPSDLTFALEREGIDVHYIPNLFSTVIIFISLAAVVSVSNVPMYPPYDIRCLLHMTYLLYYGQYTLIARSF